MRILALVLCLAALAPAARAAEGYRTGRFELGFNPGWAVPIDTTGELLQTGLYLTLTPAYQFHEDFTAGLELGYQGAHKAEGLTNGYLEKDYDQDGLPDHVPFSSDIKHKLLQVTPFVKFGRWMDVFNYRFRPYLQTGAGFYEEWTNQGTIVVNGRDTVSGKQVGPVFYYRDASANSYFGFNGGAGFDVQIDENAAVGFDLRYTRIVRPIQNWEFLTPSFRITYLF